MTITPDSTLAVSQATTAVQIAVSANDPASGTSTESVSALLRTTINGTTPMARTPTRPEHQWDAEDGDVSSIQIGFAVADRGELLRQRRPRVSKRHSAWHTAIVGTYEAYVGFTENRSAAPRINWFRAGVVGTRTVSCPGGRAPDVAEPDAEDPGVAVHRHRRFLGDRRLRPLRAPATRRWACRSTSPRRSASSRHHHGLPDQPAVDVPGSHPAPPGSSRSWRCTR